ncbi:MAG: D-2-hydroxyacid dehydrogenase [Ktedonobacterales bacterium]|nr:D-2-hydroxyacid dehydrogenase [Ktedonobacterales bacterium]
MPAGPPLQPHDVFVTDFPFTAPDQARVQAALGTRRAIFAAGHDGLGAMLAAQPAATIVCSFSPPADVLSVAPGVRWLALPSAGADIALARGLIRPGGPVVTTAAGIHMVPMREHIFSVMLLWLRGWPQRLAAQTRHAWLRDGTFWGQRELAGVTLGIIGLGAIGRGVARLGHAFDMRVVATHRSATAGATDPDVDALLPLAQLHDLLAQSDFVVLALPSTPASRGLLGAAELTAMRPHAFLVNIARGDIVDETALIAALRAGTIGGAGLDVFAHEPLPPESPLWDMPNVIISPHIAGPTDRYSERFTDLFLDNLTRFDNGQPLRNVVDPNRGY